MIENEIIKNNIESMVNKLRDMGYEVKVNVFEITPDDASKSNEKHDKTPKEEIRELLVHVLDNYGDRDFADSFASIIAAINFALDGSEKVGIEKLLINSINELFADVLNDDEIKYIIKVVRK